MENGVLDGIELGEFDLDSFINGAETDGDHSFEKELPGKRQIIIAVDASNSMQGYKIGAVNDSVNNVLSKLRSLSRGQGNNISISVIGFSTRLFRWTNQFVPASDFKYSYVETVDGLTDINALFGELTRLAESEMDENARRFVVLFSDGLPTEDYSSSLSNWQATRQYKDITKIAVSFEEDIDDPQSMSFFQEFTDHGEVIEITDQEELLSALLI